MTNTKSIPHQLSDAIQAGDVATVAKLVHDHPEHVWDKRRPRHTTWLMFAADEGQVPILEVLVAAGADVNEPKSAVPTFAPEGVIDTAASQGRLEAAQWLLDRGAKINHEINGQLRCFPLSGASIGGHLEIVKLLVERGAAINAAWAGMTALDHALTYGQQEVADYLRSVGAKTADELG